MTPLGQSGANGSIMPPNAWAAIQVSDLIPISASKSRFSPASATIVFRSIQTSRLTASRPRLGGTADDISQADRLYVVQASITRRDRPPAFLATALSCITSFIVGVREIVLKHHCVTGCQQASHESCDLLKGTSHEDVRLRETSRQQPLADLSSLLRTDKDHYVSRSSRPPACLDVCSVLHFAQRHQPGGDEDPSRRKNGQHLHSHGKPGRIRVVGIIDDANAAGAGHHL